MNPVHILNNESLKYILFHRPIYAPFSSCKWILPFKVKGKIHPLICHDGTEDE
jgi:hypothetical protein